MAKAKSKRRVTSRDEAERTLARGPEMADFADAAGNRVSYQTKCDDNWSLLTQTSGHAHTIKYPQNIGTCPMTIASFDRKGQEIKDTRIEIVVGGGFESYTSPDDSWTIRYKCPSNPSGKCVIEFDR